MVGGDEAAFERARPILEVMGATIVHCGPAGAGQVVKVCNQVVVGVVIEAVSEALVLGAKAGVDPSRIADVLQGGLAATKVLEMRRDNFLSGSFDPGFRIRLHLKDLKNAIELARDAGVALPAAAAVEQLMRAADANGRGDYDHSGLVTVLEDLAGSGSPTRSNVTEDRHMKLAGKVAIVTGCDREEMGRVDLQAGLADGRGRGGARGSDRGRSGSSPRPRSVAKAVVPTVSWQTSRARRQRSRPWSRTCWTGSVKSTSS